MNKYLKKFANDDNERQIMDNLKKSLEDEKQAVKDYAKFAESANGKAKFLWEHIGKEEAKHVKEFEELINDTIARKQRAAEAYERQKNQE